MFVWFWGVFGQRGGSLLAGRSIRCGGESVVEAFDRDEIPAFIDDGDGAAGGVFALRFRNGGGDDFLRPFEIQRFLFRHLRLCRRRQAEERGGDPSNCEFHSVPPREFRPSMRSRIGKCTAYRCRGGAWRIGPGGRLRAARRPRTRAASRAAERRNKATTRSRSARKTPSRGSAPDSCSYQRSAPRKRCTLRPASPRTRRDRKSTRLNSS